MSSNSTLFSTAAAGATAFALVAAIFLPYGLAWADGQPLASVTCPGTSAVQDKTQLTGIKPTLDQDDEYAALESVQLALTEVADGSSYVWHRAHGRLSGVVKPLASFKDTRGSVCRHAVVTLTGVDTTKETEIVACRLPTGIWQLSS
ncbi:RT0821/Lpp0805 family surface protein [Hyphomicrobium sp.]|uniref:RT0821/Lpp0805 family surface protein n=1 Tax=Hyphomicrobium sp. TaxID=82 RepID=UPI002D787510|nr:RT0821/Lpp0805 family surface protein [Hyphomicrobium sp.]HET6389462.1 RT0821/Lpp0805 family surface protein [Hyphomicrobium sp.]